jgi:competence protein ComEC
MPAVGAAKTFWLDDPTPVEPLRFRQAPMLAAAICFAAGILLARHYQPPASLLTATLLLFLLALAALRRGLFTAHLATAAFLAATGCWCAQLEPPPPTHTELLPFADGLLRNVQAHVVRIRTLKPAPNDNDPTTQLEPWQTEPGGWETDQGTATQSVDLALDALESVTPDSSTMTPVTGGVRVTVIGPALPLLCGQQLEANLRLRRPEIYRDPGAFDSTAMLAAQDITLLASAKSERLHVTGRAPRSLRCLLFAAQSWASARLDLYTHSRANKLSRLTTEDAAMLEAMLFGDRSGLTHTLREGFERTGTFHLFVVSGLHITLLAGGLLWLLLRLRVRESYSILLTLTFTTAYALLTGFGVPVQRALLMTAAYLLARYFSRTASPLNALGTAALFVLVLSPRALTEASFQMTFLVILAVAGLALPIRARTWQPFHQALHDLDQIDLDIPLEPRVAAFRVRIRMAEELARDLLPHPFRKLPRALLHVFFRILDALLFGLVTECCMVLPLAVYFHRAVWTALPVNVLCIPLLALLLPCAIALFLTSLVNSWVALPFAALTSLALHLTRCLVDHAARLALADIRLPAPPPLAVIFASLALAFSVWALRERRRLMLTLGLAAILLAPAVTLYPAPPLLHPGLLEVTALDVGQGDSLLVVTPQLKTILIDAGGPTGLAQQHASNFDIGDEVVAPFLWSRRIRRLDILALTHAHSDHMGGMPAVLRDLRPRELWLSITPARSPAFRALLDEAARLNIPVRFFHAGDAFDLGGIHTDVLAPETTYSNPGSPRNNDSLVLRLTYGASSVLLEGDAEAPSEAAMLINNRITPVTLLKVAHHGSRTSSGDAFLAAAHPKDAVISVGRTNTFGHPRGEVLARLESLGTHVYRTDRHGAQTFLLDEHGRIFAQSAASN